MRIQRVYAAIAADIAAAKGFYRKLLDRSDDRPTDVLIQSREIADTNIQIFENQENAGSSMCHHWYRRWTIHAIGIVGPALDWQRGDDIAKISKITDRTANQITLAEPPKARTVKSSKA
ncbi:hypothetical protein [Mesorhizobium loti]|uniref:hypothetical protein n=1 Tax=Rhizobium loti TaxID=381 RepID=UPI00047B49E0|nr:hypothetical protein [Mesorhizobium loti]